MRNIKDLMAWIITVIKIRDTIPNDKTHNTETTGVILINLGGILEIREGISNTTEEEVLPRTTHMDQNRSCGHNGQMCSTRTREAIAILIVHTNKLKSDSNVWWWSA